MPLKVPCRKLKLFIYISLRKAFWLQPQERTGGPGVGFRETSKEAVTIYSPIEGC